MLKNYKGVTLVVLVITIIVIVILAGTTITASDMLITSVKSKNTVTNMYLIQGKAQSLYEEYEFNGTNPSNYVGTATSDVRAYGVTAVAGDKWYIWNENTIVDLGFDDNMLSSGGEFIVNYTTGEVIYTKGAKDTDGVVKYTLSELTK